MNLSLEFVLDPLDGDEEVGVIVVIGVVSTLNDGRDEVVCAGVCVGRPVALSTVAT